MPAFVTFFIFFPVPQLIAPPQTPTRCDAKCHTSVESDWLRSRTPEHCSFNLFSLLGRLLKSVIEIDFFLWHCFPSIWSSWFHISPLYKHIKVFKNVSVLWLVRILASCDFVGASYWFFLCRSSMFIREKIKYCSCWIPLYNMLIFLSFTLIGVYLESFIKCRNR